MPVKISKNYPFTLTYLGPVVWEVDEDMIVGSRLEGLAWPHVHCFTPQNLGIEQEKNEVFLLCVSQMEALPIIAIAVGRQKGGGGRGWTKEPNHATARKPGPL